MDAKTVLSHVYKSYREVGSVWVAIATEIFKLFVYKCLLAILLAQFVLAVVLGEKISNELWFICLWMLIAVFVGAVGDFLFVKNTDNKYQLLATEYHKMILSQRVDFFKWKSASQINNLFRDHLDGTIRIIRLLRGEVLTAVMSSILPIFVVSYVQPKIGFLFFLLFSMQLFLVLWAARQVKSYRKGAISKYNQINKEVAEHIANIVAIKAGSQEVRMNGKIKMLAKEEQNLLFKRHLVENFSEIAKLIFAIVITIMIFYFIGVSDLSYNSKVELSVMVCLYVFQVFSVITDCPALIKKTGEHIERLASTLNALDIIADEDGDRSRIKIESYGGKNAIEIKNLSFGYSSANNVIEGLSLSIPNGEGCAVLGVSGSGKSTLAGLIMKFYPAQPQEIYIYGCDITKLCDSELRNLVSYAPQQPNLLQGSIRDNICLYNPDASDEEIELVAKIVCIHDFVNTLPEKYEASVGNLGDTLSGGQKQRLIIARALLKKSEIYIFDESSSAMGDSLTREVIQNMLAYLKGKTQLYLTHDPIVYGM